MTYEEMLVFLEVLSGNAPIPEVRVIAASARGLCEYDPRGRLREIAGACNAISEQEVMLLITEAILCGEEDDDELAAAVEAVYVLRQAALETIHLEEENDNSGNE